MYIPALLAPGKDEFRFRIRVMISFWERRAFVRAPWRFYGGDPYWVPPLLSERSALQDPRRNPFLRPLESAFFRAEATRGFSLDEGGHDCRLDRRAQERRVRRNCGMVRTVRVDHQ